MKTIKIWEIPNISTNHLETVELIYKDSEALLRLSYQEENKNNIFCYEIGFCTTLGDETIWLSDPIPTQYLSIDES